MYIRQLLIPGVMSRRLTNGEFIEKARRVHGDKYEYTERTYTTSSVPIRVICPLHGEFQQVAGDHLRGFGCSACSGKRRLTTDQFIEKAQRVHLGRYDYSRVNYISSNTPVTILCPKHGEFSIKPTFHLYGTQNGCGKCCYSKGEVFVADWLTGRGVEFARQVKFPGCKNPKTGHQLRFDFYIPALNLCIEVDGLQHQAGKHFMRGKCLDVSDVVRRDAEKTRFCEEAGIGLERVPWLGNRTTLASQLERIFNQPKLQ